MADLAGSYEQQPPNLLAELQRDRRWCQGNLQNSRLMAEPGLHPVHRAMFVTGALAYLSAPLWLAFLTLGTALWLTGSSDGRRTGSCCRANWPACGLWTLCLLFLPRVLGVAAVLMRGEQRQLRRRRRPAAERRCSKALLSVLQAPVRMLAHSLFVLGRADRPEARLEVAAARSRRRAVARSPPRSWRR